jgi:hypothetical protein
VKMFKNLSPKVYVHQRAECAGGGVADEVKDADLLCDDAQAWAGTESLYLWAKDLAFATTFDVPGTYTSWFVYSEMKARCRCWPSEVGGETLLRAKIKGLWSVHS